MKPVFEVLKTSLAKRARQSSGVVVQEITKHSRSADLPERVCRFTGALLEAVKQKSSV
jgi:hypothetical protein